MPLFSQSINIAESDASSRKRSHADFVDGSLHLTDALLTSENQTGAPKGVTVPASALDFSMRFPVDLSPVHIRMDSPLPGSSSPAQLTEGGSSDITHNSMSPSPNGTPSKLPASHDPITPTNPSTTSAQPASTMLAPTAVKTAVPPPAKKKRKSPAELEAENAVKRQKKDEEAADKAAKAEAKARADAEKAAEKAARAEAKARADAEKEAAKQAKAADKAAKDAAKAAKVAEKEALEEQKRKQQTNLFSFVKRSDKPTDTTKAAAKPEVASASNGDDKEAPEPEKSAYELMFQPFFVKKDVTLANTISMDEEAQNIKSRRLEEYIQGTREEFNPKPFNPTETFQLNGLQVIRGIDYTPVKSIMAEMFGDPMEDKSGVAPKRTESQQMRYAFVRRGLDQVPMKMLSFYEDVRPPYVGTVTSNIPVSMRKLARNPNRRLLAANYDYESEAEWEEEEGEDLDDEDDDDDEVDVDEEMADFLDDAEDVVAAAAVRPSFLMEGGPKSTGICYENRKRIGPCATVFKYRTEFLLPTLEHHHSIDPFSTEYWPQPAKRGGAKTGTKTGAKSGVKQTAKQTATHSPASSVVVHASATMPPPPNPKDAYAMLLTSPQSTTTPTTPPKSLVPMDLLDDFKRAIVSDDINFLTKVGMIDMLAKRFSTCTRAQVKLTLEKIADRMSVPGRQAKDKRWQLFPAFALPADSESKPEQVAQPTA